ncbi:MAG: tRNA preQ1(34) S-adenosylmethionine ribosyltransferase-isomerase QueA [Alphaproteobacteria bacterium]
MRVEAFEFDLPEGLIALRPARPRDSARMLVVPPAGAFEDRVVRDLPSLLKPGDLLVMNDTRVIPARLLGVRRRGGAVAHVEANLLARLSPSRWSAFAKPGKRIAVGEIIEFAESSDRACALAALGARLVEKREGGEVVLEFEYAGAVLDEALAAYGLPPLPPYILSKRAAEDADRDDYQTTFAREDGSIAAPTAGLHFTPDLLAALAARGVESAFVTLHVGAGTFLPMKVEDTADHVMHAEWRSISAETAEQVNRARAEGRRVIAVGTTAMRTLESAASEEGRVSAGAGDTSIFITPGYRFRAVDGLITNFHLPRSTLFMLVSAFAGLERMRAAYTHAIAQGYRFYSYGDASLLWRADG